VTDSFLFAAWILLAAMAVGLFRILIGPTSADRLLAAQLVGTSGIGVLLLLAHILEAPALADVSLVFALLAAVSIATFVRCSGTAGSGSGGDS
jgi:multicomponent Na+:H+ antiporter subunit F